MITYAIINFSFQGPCVQLGVFERSRFLVLFFFSSKIFKPFSRLRPCFRKVLHFFLLLFLIMGFEFSTANGSPASVSDHVMTSQDYIKVENVRTWLLSSSLANFQKFYSEIFFQFFVSVFLPFYQVCIQKLHLGAVCTSGCFWKNENIVFVLIFVWNLQTSFPFKPMFSKGPSFFVLFFVIMGLWNSTCTW